MELKDFISNTIEQISLGILEASKKCNQYGVIVNPNITIGEQGDFCIPKQPEHVNIQRRVQLIDMDIAVTVIESEEGKIEGKLGVSFIGVGGKSQEGKSTSNESRVKFSIPVCLPVTNIIGNILNSFKNTHLNIL
ncbi:hypothetical protein Q4467_13560 [Phocaeicola vulgatus]|uniref:trypco2 family protein n=1 Tax=Phocaeicola vulgatus TaxID=821 RepID=UPI0026E35B01|nr:trypco2 family protein [Phocaeicola vulgatus]MDO6196637.1 hypothetical protein [Phocaeicola vulgatus]MDO6200474.1 hypothetical protein [Phocaeicola vulgatus]